MAPRIIALGEILWDLLPSGRQLGGAPANFAIHAHALGGDVRLISCVGDDELGREARDAFLGRGMSTDTIAVDAAAPTGTVAVTVGPDGQPSYRIVEDVAWDRIVADSAALAAASIADAVCFGSLAQRSAPARSAIRTLVAAAPPASLRIFDVNLRAPHIDAEAIESSLCLANALKLNDQELPILAAMFGLPTGEREGMLALVRRFGLQLIALTRGAAGSMLHADGAWADHPGLPTKVVDTVGAGDAFTAVLTIGRLAGWPLAEINRRANEVAAFVCSQPGATPELPPGLVGAKE
jgi:fructokinase